ncbi:hypothetical protein [Dactylosporangium sp. NPDC048998]|uniref:hypothetical protein n=1 Tax=Dactylosporangium sp. NPDC048998 TaxID=3363976 RepID=UPI003719BBB7
MARRRQHVAALRDLPPADWPAHLPRFEAYAASQDPDIAWIVQENRGKARLR